MKSILLTGLIFFIGVSQLHGQINFTATGLEVENHQEFDVVVEGLSQDALNIGLTESRIRSRVNLRLRQVGLRINPDISEYLYIRINVIGISYSVDISFTRRVSFLVGDIEHRTSANVYDKLMTGTHGRNSEFIISSLDQLLDIFLSDYLDANDEI